MSSTGFMTTRVTDAQSPGRVIRRSHERGDYALTASCVGLVTLLCILRSGSVVHWFLLPVMACGILSGVDVIRWLRGRLDIFDPRAVVACLAFYGFFIAPLLHVIWDRFGVGYDLILSGDWRPWLGAMAALNAVGLILYRLLHNWVFNRTETSTVSWEIDGKRFYPIFGFAWCLSAGGIAYFFWQFNGFFGVVEAFDTDKTAFVGKGWLLVFGWPLAVLSFIILVFAWTDRRGKKVRHHLTTALLMLGAAGVVHFLAMGWYGSRAATIWALFWMAGIIQYRFRKFSRRWAGAGLVFMMAFMYFYGFYKERGRTGFEVLRSPAMWLDPEGYERDFKSVLLEDLARADTDAYLLHNIVKYPDDYEYRWGLTYAGALAILIPRNFWPDRPEFTVEAGTEAQLGKATSLRSSRVYGLSGEALLNFGPGGVPLVFAIYGALLGWYRRKVLYLYWKDARIFLAPFFTILFAMAFIGDSDTVVFGAVTEGALIFICLFAASRRHPAAETA